MQPPQLARLADLAQLAGFILVVAGVWLVSHALALVVAGGWLFAAGGLTHRSLRR